MAGENGKGVALTTPQSKPNNKPTMPQEVTSSKVIRAKRVIAHIDTTEELRSIQKYISERWEIINERRREAKRQAQWEKIAALPIGTEVAVNAHGYRQFPRGTVFSIDAFSVRGRRCVYLKSEDGKRYSFDRKSIDDFDIKPRTEVDLNKMWDTGRFAL